ncbi:hypothetical protein SLA2020_419790 [Shorea laevis]
MQATSLYPLRFHHAPSSAAHCTRRWGSNQFLIIRRPTAMVYASNKDAYGHDYDGKVVDENMTVLRERIHGDDEDGEDDESRAAFTLDGMGEEILR